MSSENEKNSGKWLEDAFCRDCDAVVVTDGDMRILRVNSAAARLLGGGRPDRLENRNFLDFIPEAGREKCRCDIERVLKGEWDFTETRIVCGDRETPVVIHAIPTSFCDRPATLLHVRDTTIFNVLEKALKASRDEWEQSFDAITDAVCILNRHGKVIRANRAAERLFAAFGNPVGTHFKELLRMPAGSGPVLPDIITESAVRIPEAQFESLKGWFSLNAYPLRNEQNETTGAIIIIHDVTERHVMQETLARTDHEKRQMSKMAAVGRLVDGVAHDFNNFLSVILGYSNSALKMLPSSHAAYADVQQIIRTGEQAASLIRQLLNFSHETKGDTYPLNINMILKGMADALRRTLNETITLTWKPAEELWETKADAVRIEQIIMNLALNAAEAMPQGGTLTIETSNITLTEADCAGHPGLKAGDFVLLSVSDTGCGMSRETMDHIFEPFFTTKPHKGGTGIGLTTVYGIIKQFGGHITCYSELGKGTVFKVYLPRAALGESDKTEKSAKKTPAPAKGETLLVIDDEPQILSLVSRILAAQGYKVLTAGCGADAMAAARENKDKIRLIICDVVLPDIGGQELAKNIKQELPAAGTIFTSGYSEKVMAQSGMLKQEDVFISKPFSIEQLMNAIRRLLDTGESK